MAPKRSLPETATETSPKPKKRVSLASSDTKVVVKKGKRKVDTLDPVEDEIVPKAPRRVSTKTAARKAATVEVPAVEIETEIVIVAVEKKPRVIKKKIVATEPLSGEADDTKPVRARAVRKKIIKEDVVTIAPSAHSPDATVIATSIGSTDTRKFFVPPVSLDNDGEIMGLWQQYCATIDMCTSTVTPLFLVLILGLYAASAVTNSQTIASIGLVYVFVFLVIMGSYFFAIVPFILASTIISNQISPRGKSTEKFSTRIFLLIAAIAAVITYYKYGLPSMG